MRLLLLLTVLPFCSSRSSSSSRGMSSARTSISNNRVSSAARPSSTSNSGYRPSYTNRQTTTYNNNYNRGTSGQYTGYNGYTNRVNYVPVPSRGSGSSNSAMRTFGGGFAGALAGVATFQAGKAILRSATRPVNYGGRNYYWDQNVPQQTLADDQQCSVPLDVLKQNLTAAGDTDSSIPSDILFEDGSRPKQITWLCKRNSEVCCNFECCDVNGKVSTVNEAGTAGLGQISSSSQIGNAGLGQPVF